MTSRPDQGWYWLEETPKKCKDCRHLSVIYKDQIYGHSSILIKNKDKNKICLCDAVITTLGLLTDNWHTNQSGKAIADKANGLITPSSLVLCKLLNI